MLLADSTRLESLSAVPSTRLDYRQTSPRKAVMADYSSLLHQFQTAIQHRIASEEILAELSSGPDQYERQLQQSLTHAQTQRDDQLESLEQDHREARQQTENRFAELIHEATQSQDRAEREVQTKANAELDSLEKKRADSEWVVSSMLDDSAEDSPMREFEKFQSLLEKSREEQTAEWADLQSSVKDLQEQRSWSGDLPEPAVERLANREAASQRFSEHVREARELIEKIQSLTLPKLFSGFNSLIVFTVLTALVAVPIWMFVDPAVAGQTSREGTEWILLSFGGGAIGGLLLSIIMWTLGSMQQSDLIRSLLHATADAEWTHQQWLSISEKQLESRRRQFEKEQKRVEREREQALNKFEATHNSRVSGIESERDRSLVGIQQHYQETYDDLTSQRDTSLQQLDQQYQQRVQEALQAWSSEIQRLEQGLENYSGQRRRRYAETWSQTKNMWEQASQVLGQSINEASEQSQQRFRPWSELIDRWSPEKHIPEQLPIGRWDLNLNDWDGAVSNDVRLAPRTTQYRLPATLEFPNECSVLFESPSDEARQQAIATMQSLMLRLLTLIPPGKIRFTIIDPVSLGESFGGFMHLTDYDELMVTNRVWTESGQIEARLADLTEHMENVLQKYLRNEFQTIEEYNESAGEVAEPYHFLVISDFPAKFSEIAARRLVSIVNSGPRCGVYTLMNFDPGKPLPNNFELSDIEGSMTRLIWENEAFRSPDPVLRPWPIQIDAPPEPSTFTTLVKKIGDASKDARRVEVSFSRIAPKQNEIWNSDSRSEIEIPLGRAGATKLQTMKLGRGTSQHMLVAGKTGSGKSTFLHILITNLALHYSPDEVNFYLIDFKKGVEFKSYASHNLPHARVIAIESDREFGVSALQRLDEVLQERGELFRRHGVQDIAGFRNANPETPMPRILLMVDEFQEFFIEDDKLSQSASLLLDRLVRQGRAFGIHVILGSQTLGGAYSLARSTMGQVAIRVALQCSEADAHLILSEENTAARLLTRPGEAIYNDANGMLEGNHPFQIAWLNDEVRDEHLDHIQERFVRSGIESQPMIVFEGNIPSDITRNQELNQLAQEFSTREEPVRPPKIWLGDAVEIKPATHIAFQWQSGSNLLIVGQDSDMALGMMTTSLVALAASYRKQLEKPTLYLFNGSPVDAPETAVWEMISETLPIDIVQVTPRNVTEHLNTLSEELKAREASDDVKQPAIFSLIYDIAKFRDLKKAEDDYGLGSFGSSSEEKPPEPGKQFSELLSNGPLNGMHSIIWCDSFNNVDRWFSRQTMRELELRVAFQMNASDSSNLIDSPIASRLGTHRALLYREETGTSEKFRPYGLPGPDWIESIRNLMLNGPDGDFATDLEEFSIL